MKQYTQQVFVCIAFLLIKSPEWGWVILFGTKLHFRIEYFFTVFLPSILILLLKIGDLKKMFNWIMLIIFLSVISVICIKKELKSRQSNSKYSSTNIVINFDVQQKRLKHGYVIQVQNNSKVNLGFIPFATSIIVDNNNIYASLIIQGWKTLLFPNPPFVLLLPCTLVLNTEDSYGGNATLFRQAIIQSHLWSKLKICLV